MRAALVHRGPDEGSTDAFGACVLGHQRLRVLDLETGQQPVANETGEIVAVFNGELYNFDELRRELAANGHDVRGTGDTPVIPHLYEEAGPRFVERLRGMFALALWDAPRGRLVLARDRLGKKPLLWTRLPDGTFAFASELKALLRLPRLERELDLRALDEYLALQYVRAPATALRGVRKLEPGQLLVLENGEERVESYWEPAATPEQLSDEEWIARVRSTLAEAVRTRLVADVPLGALLSGGIDSSIVVALAAQASAEPVRTFTVGFDDVHYDERAYARAVAERYGTRHEELVVDAEPHDALPRLAETLDEPLGDEAALPLYLICEQARGHVTVALTGDGGDEAFAGYERYAAHGLANRLSRVPRPLLRSAARALRNTRAASREPRSRANRVARFLDSAATSPGSRYGGLMEVFSPELRRELWSDTALAELDSPVSAADLLGAPRARGVTGLQLLDLDTYLPGDLLPKADLASMAHSLELRSPFLDHEVVELALGLPDHLKLNGRQGKIALRRAFADDLPPETTARGKRGFGVPLARWFRGELRETARQLLLDPRARERGYFRPAAVDRLLDDHAAGRADHGHRLWCLVVLELWQQTHVEAPVRGGATLVRS